MKKIFLVLVIGMIFVSGCAKEKEISFTIENLNDKQLSQGIYYEYKYNNEGIKGKDINAELILSNLIKKNIPIIEAWYKGYSASCCPPEQKEPVKCMQAIVEPVFLINLVKETELKDFARVDEPKIGWCAYTIKHYIIR